MKIDESKNKEIHTKSVSGNGVVLRFSDGSTKAARRYFPAGKGDVLNVTPRRMLLHAKNDDDWLQIGKAWRYETEIKVSNSTIPLIFKEIETDSDLEQYQQLREFHYRGGGGAGRNIPIIGRSTVWDLPSVLGFVEITSSMIASTARKKFFDSPYESEGEVLWLKWDRSAGKRYSNLICRISRFVIHPEIRGLGLSKPFLDAAIRFSRDRWHFGGYRPHFIEITADMLRFYPFVDGSDFVLMGNTEGNEHRLKKDMSYLVRKAVSPEGEKSMPQGGGGIMALQRGYARQIVEYMNQSNKRLPEVIDSLKYDPASLDQDAWEALYRINRRPKPSYICGLTKSAKKYVDQRRLALAQSDHSSVDGLNDGRVVEWSINGLSIEVSAAIEQSTDGRLLQDTFGFVGRDVEVNVLRKFDFKIRKGEITFVCGASGSGKTLFLKATEYFLTHLDASYVGQLSVENAVNLNFEGTADKQANISVALDNLDEAATALDLKGKAGLSEFVEITAVCGLAEPQLLVRPIYSLSSGQKYRLSVALAFLSNPDIVIIDNFCESLDRYTMLAVCRGVRWLSKSQGNSGRRGFCSIREIGQITRLAPKGALETWSSSGASGL